MRRGPIDKAKASSVKYGQFVVVVVTGFFSVLVATVPDSALDLFARSFSAMQVPMGWSRYTRPVFPLTALLFEGG